MNRNLITPLLLISALFFSCSKSSQPSPKGGGTSNNVKIELVSGNNQVDTIGSPLANHVVFKITGDNLNYSNYSIIYEGSGCNADRGDQYSVQSDGTGSYIWYLAGDVGQQTLKAIVVDGQNHKLDSVTAVCTALPAGHGGWHISACSYPFDFTITALGKSGTGRLFVTLSGGPAYMRYSDDNGASWLSVKSLGKTHRFEYVAASLTNEVFAVADDGTFYSKDNGETWTSLPKQSFSNTTISGEIFTPTDKIFISTSSSGTYVSSDKGNTWTSSPASAFVTPNSTGNDDSFVCPVEDQNGNLYVIGGESEVIYKSTDGGKNWSPMSFPNIRFASLFIDKNNWFYASVNGFISSGVYVSKDNATTFTPLYTSSNGFNNELTVQSDGNLYYTNTNLGLYRLTGAASGTPTLIYEGYGPLAGPYIVAANNNVITPNGGGILFYNNQ